MALDKAPLAIGIVAILIAAGSFAYTSSVVGGLASQQALNDLKSSVDKSASDITKLSSQLTTTSKSLEEAEAVLSAAQAEADFIAAAQAEAREGGLIIYGAMDVPDLLNIVWPQFQAVYPWVGEVQYIEGFDRLKKRFQEEAARGVRTADVRLDSGTRALQDLGAGLVMPLETKNDGLYQKSQIIDGALHHAWGNVGVIVYNTNLVSADEAPKSWSELGDPKWKGEIICGDPRAGGTAAAQWNNILMGVGEEEFRKIVKGVFLDNECTRDLDFGSLEYNKVLAGEYKLGTSLLNDLAQQKEGTPMAAAPTKGVGMGATFAYVHKDTPKPNLAKLFVEWFIGPQGQAQVGVTGRTPSLSTLISPSSVGNLLPAAESVWLNPETFTDPEGTFAKFKKMFAEIGVPE